MPDDYDSPAHLSVHVAARTDPAVAVTHRDTEHARERLRLVRTQAEAAAGKPLDWSARGRDVGGPWWDDAFAVGCSLLGVVLVALVVIVAITVVGWIV